MAIDLNRPFAWEVRHWISLSEFELYVASVDTRWAQREVLHHTYRPVAATWRGEVTMVAMKKTFLTNENGTWDSGPHLFLVRGSPDPTNDGIWQGTPLWRSGIAAGVCNKDGIMVEVVGDYDKDPWPADVASLVYDVSRILLRKIKKPVTTQTLKGHRECLPNKTCPGSAIDMNQVRAELRRRMELPVIPVLPPGTFPVDPRFIKAWTASGGIYRGPQLLAPGYAKSGAYLVGSNWYQDFERGRARCKPDGSIEWLFFDELPA